MSTQHTTFVSVPVHFTGSVTVEVPYGLSPTQIKKLARKIAVATVVATCDNPDGPEEDAFDELCEELKVEE